MKAVSSLTSKSSAFLDSTHLQPLTVLAKKLNPCGKAVVAEKMPK